MPTSNDELDLNAKADTADDANPAPRPALRPKDATKAVGSSTQPVVSAELLRVEDVCTLLRTTKRSVYRLADTGKMPWGLKLNGMRRWRRAELVAWLDAGCPPVRATKGVAR